MFVSREHQPLNRNHFNRCIWHPALVATGVEPGCGNGMHEHARRSMRSSLTGGTTGPQSARQPMADPVRSRRLGELIRVPTYRHADVVVDPSRAFGAPIFERGGARVDDVLERYWADESMDELADEFGVPVDQLEDVVRVASRRAA